MRLWATLLPSPRYARRRPDSTPKCCRSVSRSARAWQGWWPSVSALMTGIVAAAANRRTSSSAYVRITKARAYRLMTPAVSSMVSPAAELELVAVDDLGHAAQVGDGRAERQAGAGRGLGEVADDRVATEQPRPLMGVLGHRAAQQRAGGGGLRA